MRHEQFQLETSKEEKAIERKLERKIVTNDLKAVKQMKIDLQESVCELVADNLSIDAEEKNDFRLLSRSNDLQKHANCKSKEIDDLDKLAENRIL